MSNYLFKIPVNIVEKELYWQLYGNDMYLNAEKTIFWFNAQFLKVEIPPLSQTLFDIYG